MVCGKFCQVFETSSGKWSKFSSWGGERDYAGAVDAGDSIYILGGHGGHQKEMFFLPHGSPTWTRMTQNIPRDGVYKSCVVPLNTHSFLVIGGNGKHGSKQVMQYNTENHLWINWPDLPFKLSGHACLKTGNKIIITGGWNGNNFSSPTYEDPNDHYFYNPKTLILNMQASYTTTITYGGNIQSERTDHKMAWMGDKIVAIGGYFQKDGSFRELLATIEEWNEETETWSISTSLRLKKGRREFALLSIPATDFSLCDSNGKK